MDKQTNSSYAIPILALNGSIFFVKFHTQSEREARIIASCISHRAPNLLTLLTDDE